MKFVQILSITVLVACLVALAPSPAEAGKKKMVKSAALLALVLKNHFHKQLGFFPLPLPIPVAIEQKLPPKYPSYPSYPSYQPSYSQPSYAASYQEPSYSAPSYDSMDSYATNDHQTYSANNNNQQYDLSQYVSADEGADYASHPY
ncbi:hypothetical protein GZH46_02308 [Fragariocoptes setiger]|uniref:Uncharacterized protein n=1 Tax=Fragariocoptes setiger TaxID=1670756 RepID=A0ABQ7S6Z7_9ACAR|nr:hypothetical protein GZH46_02308 [Fragariocoptes setiger]